MNCSIDSVLFQSAEALCASPEHVFALASLGARLANAEGAADLARMLREATRKLGVGAAYFASTVREDTTYDSFRLLVACDPVWSQKYEAMQGVLSDPWLRYAHRHSEPVLSTAVESLDDRERQTVLLAAEHGFRSALIVPAPASGHRSGALVLGADQDGFFQGHARSTLTFLARGLALELQDRVGAMTQLERTTCWHLTPLELELLNYEREGKPTKTIASLLGCSIGAVDQRFHRLNGKLGVTKRRQAARLVAAYGLI